MYCNHISYLINILFLVPDIYIKINLIYSNEIYVILTQPKGLNLVYWVYEGIIILGFWGLEKSLDQFHSYAVNDIRF